MKKVSLLAASVAIALAGCGGGSDSNTDGNTGPVTPPPAGGVIITGFDGYFKNAVMFVDQNNNGVWDASENILGLTNEKGQIELTEKPTGTLALQTITPNGKAQAQLIGMGDKFAGVYTVDMDHPGQAMAHELVFRAPNNSDVISPITDLVALEMKAGKTAEEAEAAVNLALGGTEAAPIDLFSDFVTGSDANAELHKTAQILTESKAKNPTNYEKKATEFATVASDEVEKMTEEEVKDVNNKPVIEDANPESDNLVPEVITNSKLIVDATVKEKEAAKIPLLKEHDDFTDVTLNLQGLFIDNDQKNGVIPTLTHDLDGTGITVSFIEGDLTLSATQQLTEPGKYSITLTATDLDSEGAELDTAGKVSTVFNITIEAFNQAPVVVEAEKIALQNQIDSWDLQAGEEFHGSINVSALFEDKDGSVVSYWGTDITVKGLDIPDVDKPTQTIEGTPAKQYAAGETSFRIVVRDDEGAVAETTFTLPEVKEGVLPPPADKHPLVGKTWYYLENGSNDGDDTTHDYSRVWCEAVKFEEGTIYGVDRTPENRTVCTEPTANWGSYEIIGDKIIPTFTRSVNAKAGMSYEVDNALNAELISKGAQSVQFSEDGFSSLYTYFSNKADAQARITVQSEAGYEGRAFPMYLPDETEPTWNLGSVSMALTERNPGEFSSYINFDVEGKDFTCTNLEEFYRQFTLTSEDLNANSQYISGSCNTINENGTKYASVSFNLSGVNNLEMDNVYSFIGSTYDNKGQYVENVKFSVTWTGTGDNE